MSKLKWYRNGNPHKLLFLDVDGVLNSSAYFQSKEYKRCRVLTRYNTKQYDLKKLDLLKEIVKKTNCTVVMSSSWRYFYFDPQKSSRAGVGCMQLKRDLKIRGIRIKYKTGNEYDNDLYKKYSSMNVAENEDSSFNFFGKNSCKNPITEFYERGLQIKNFITKWERKHGKVKFVVLDDDIGDLFLFGDNFVNTKWYSNTLEEGGITKETVEKCIQLLGKKHDS